MIPILNVQDIVYTYPQTAAPILNGLTLTVGRGEFISLLGANGCGKSTLFKILTKTLGPLSGRIQIQDGVKVAYIAQNMGDNLFMDLTLQENLQLMRLQFSSVDRMRAYLLPYHRRLPFYLHQPVKMLSGGEKQALILAATLYHKPDLLLLDEHTSALDPEAEKDLMALTAQHIRQSGITTLMCTHKLALAHTYSSRLVGLNKGKIIVDIPNEHQELSEDYLQKIYL